MNARALPHDNHPEARLAPTVVIHLLSPSELSEALGIPVKTLYAWRLEGKGPVSVKVGRHVRYRPGDVERWIRNLA